MRNVISDLIKLKILLSESNTYDLCKLKLEFYPVLHFMSSRVIFSVLIFFLPFFISNIFSQCNSYPVSLEQRVLKSNYIVKATVKEKIVYKELSGNIYTLNKLDIMDVIKGDTVNIQFSAITIGGELGNEMQVSFPAVQLLMDKEYIIFLEPDNYKISNSDIKKINPDLKQLLIYADAQGAMELHQGQYYDVLYHKFYNEDSIYSIISKINNGISPKKINKNARRINAVNTNAAIAAISSVSHAQTDGGTIDVADFITITGSGFGSTRGTSNVNFRNVDNGGATWISPIPSDYTSWSDASITVKVPESAGTGQIDVAGTLSSSPITIGFTHASINSSFATFSELTRQRYYFRNKNGTGGYTFSLNSTSGFSGNLPAVTALQNAMTTWTCNTGMNWDLGTTTSSAFALDNINVVLFDATLPAGVLGRLTNRYNGGATGACLGMNTIWWLNEIDLQMKPNPPAAGYTWQYGPSAPSLSEYDFESVLLHELGHAHGLGHRIAPGQTMNYTLFNGVTSRTLDTAEINGAAEKMNYSKLPTCFDPAGSGTPASSQSCSLSLPVELLHFDANKQDDNVLVSWTTISEHNNDFFTIEKSNNAIDFVPIGFSDAAGNSNMEINYKFTDAEPTPGLNYYRLKQTDFDGSYTYSRIVKVYFEESILPELNIFPNPATENLNININTQFSDGFVTITDVKGAVLYNEKISSSSENYSNMINIGNFPNGMYLIKVITTSKSFFSKFLKN